jgi:hypothetical protein
MAIGLNAPRSTLKTFGFGDAAAVGQGAVDSPPQRQVALWPSDVASLMALAFLALGFAAPYACTRLQILLTIILVLHRSPLWLPALILMQFTPTDFKGGYGATMDVQYERFDGLTIYVFGFPLTPNFTLVLSVVARAVYDAVTYPGRFRHVLSPWLLLPVLVASLVSAYNSVFLGLFERVPGWSAPLRTALGSLALWYGVAIATDWQAYKAVMLRRVSLIAAAFVVCAFFFPMNNVQYCFLIPFGSACAISMLTAKEKKPPMAKPLAIGTLSMSTLNYLVGTKASEAVIEATKQSSGGVVSQTTNTVMAGAPVALMLIRARIVSPKNLGIATAIATIAFATYVALPFYLASLNKDVEVRANTAVTFYERAIYKLFYERSSIWRGKIKLISAPPYVFVAPSRVSTWITPGGKEMLWRPSAHNMVLEHLASEGLLSGGINLLIVFVAFLAAVRAWLARPDAFSGALATTFIIGMMWNGFGLGNCADSAASFLLLTTAGACCIAAAGPANGSVRALSTIRRGGSPTIAVS